MTFTATFTATAVGTDPMTGTVAFYDGTTYLGTEPLASTSQTNAASLPRRGLVDRRWISDGLRNGQLLDLVPGRRQPQHHGRLLG